MILSLVSVKASYSACVNSSNEAFPLPILSILAFNSLIASLIVKEVVVKSTTPNSFIISFNFSSVSNFV